MSLVSLEVQNLRNLEKVGISPGQKVNIFFGQNGAGKTSVLEAIYILGTGKSFRTNKVRKLIRDDASDAIVTGKVLRENEKLTSIGVRRGRTRQELKVNGQAEKSRASLAFNLPLMVITPESHGLLAEGPGFRRRFMDWGVFHVEHGYSAIWSEFNRVLKHRNKLLQSQASDRELLFWTEKFLALSDRLTAFREGYVSGLAPYAQEFCEEFFKGSQIQLEYRTGLSTGQTLAEALESGKRREIASGRTEVGPHRADLQIKLDGKDIQHRVSRGQQKLLVYILQLAQCKFLRERNGTRTSLLLDDLSAELDLNKFHQLNELLTREFDQIFITTTSIDNMPDPFLKDAKLFHVERGNVSLFTN